MQELTVIVSFCYLSTRVNIRPPFWSAPLSNSQINSWIGNSNNSWHHPANWSCGVVPNELIDIVIPKNTQFNCTIDAPVSCKSLSVAPEAVIINNSHLQIKN